MHQGWIQGDNPAMAPDCYCSLKQSQKIFSLSFPNLCDNFVKKLVSEIRKCQLQSSEPLTIICWRRNGQHWLHARHVVQISQISVIILLRN